MKRIVLLIALISSFLFAGNVTNLWVDNATQLNGALCTSYKVFNPTSSTTINIPANVRDAVIDITWNMTTLGVMLPSNPLDGQEVHICSPRASISSLTVSCNRLGCLLVTANSAVDIINGLGLRYKFLAPRNKWFRL